MRGVSLDTIYFMRQDYDALYNMEQGAVVIFCRKEKIIIEIVM